jgi:methylmalonyl-CoA mutase cobalamin-binding domain/chain
VVAGLRAEGRGDALVLVGGIIPAGDVAALEAAGVSMVFGPGTSIGDIVTFVNTRVAPRD